MWTQKVEKRSAHLRQYRRRIEGLIRFEPLFKRMLRGLFPVASQRGWPVERLIPRTLQLETTEFIAKQLSKSGQCVLDQVAKVASDDHQVCDVGDAVLV